jgi:protein HIRA/HIR1
VKSSSLSREINLKLFLIYFFFFRAIFEKSGSSGKVESYATVALGSRDRSISVWSTNLKRPFFVINDIFEQSVLDLSWSKDGRVLLAW